MYAVIRRVVDHGELLEVHAGFARNVIVGFARISGVIVGIVANQPMVMAGALDLNAADKVARFVRTCNIFNVPVVTLVDVPGFLPGVEQERSGIIRHGAKMLFAYGSCTAPKITVILRKAYGGSYLAMCSQEMGADMVYAWPTAEIAVMGAEGAAKLLYGKAIAAAEDPAKAEAEFIADYKERLFNPYQAADVGQVDEVITPSETRLRLIRALEVLRTKVHTNIPKKHGLFPV